MNPGRANVLPSSRSPRRSPELCTIGVARPYSHTHARTHAHKHHIARAHLQHISIGAMHSRIKRLWSSSRAAFLRSKQRAVAETGESIVPEGEWCGEGEVSEVSLRPAGDRECGVVWICVLRF